MKRVCSALVLLAAAAAPARAHFVWILPGDPAEAESVEPVEPVPALELVEPAPDAVRLLRPEGVVEAAESDGARGTDRLGASLTSQPVVLAFGGHRREELDRLRASARRLDGP